jgi:hypothetical protein
MSALKALPCQPRGPGQGHLVRETISRVYNFRVFWDLRAPRYTARSMSRERSNGACSSSSCLGVPGWESRREDVADKLGA